jgi:hypothetical protein
VDRVIAEIDEAALFAACDACVPRTHKLANHKLRWLHLMLGYFKGLGATNMKRDGVEQAIVELLMADAVAMALTLGGGGGGGGRGGGGGEDVFEDSRAHTFEALLGAKLSEEVVGSVEGHCRSRLNGCDFSDRAGTMDAIVRLTMRAAKRLSGCGLHSHALHRIELLSDWIANLDEGLRAFDNIEPESLTLGGGEEAEGPNDQFFLVVMGGATGSFGDDARMRNVAFLAPGSEFIVRCTGGRGEHAMVEVIQQIQKHVVGQGGSLKVVKSVEGFVGERVCLCVREVFAFADGRTFTDKKGGRIGQMSLAEGEAAFYEGSPLTFRRAGGGLGRSGGQVGDGGQVEVLLDGAEGGVHI